MFKKLFLISLATISLSTATPAKADPGSLTEVAIKAALVAVVAVASPITIVKAGGSYLSGLAFAALETARLAIGARK